MSGGGVFQSSLYIGMNTQNILYGVELCLYFGTIHIILTNGGAYDKSNLFHMLFSSMMVFLVTVWVVVTVVFCDNMWFLHSDFPGGPDVYWEKNVSIWYMDWGTTAIIVLQLMTDALMIHRCRIIWNSYRVVTIPIILWLATLALGVVFGWTSSLPGANYLVGLTAKLCLAYYIVAVFLNTILTWMICYRMVRHGKKVKEHLGNEYASLYFTAATMVVESVLPYTLSGIAFLVLTGIGSPMSVTFASVYVLMMCISPQILILRVIMGKAWDKDTFNPPASTVKFSPESILESQGFDGNGVRVQLVERPSPGSRQQCVDDTVS